MKEGSVKVVKLLLIFSIVIGGPFIMKSLYYTGTPLFPFKTGLLGFHKIGEQDPQDWAELNKKAERIVATKDDYGSGRSAMDFLQHLWLISVAFGYG